MQKEKPKNQNKSSKYSYTTISDYFLDEWASVVGVGPTALYIQLLKYCYKGKDIAWPTLSTLSKKVGVAENTIIRYRKILVKYGFIKNIFKKKSTSRNNIYQMTLGQDLGDSKILSNMVTKCNASSEISPSMVTNCKVEDYKMSSSMVTKCNPNNNNINNINIIITTKRKKDAAVAAVNFNKSKKAPPAKAVEKGEERVQAIREQLADLSFEESFIEKLIKDFPLEKIEEKLELLMIKTNIQNPAGWLRASLKYDYQNPEQEKYDEELVGQASRLSSGNKKTLPKEGMKEAASREKALEMIRNTREMLANL